MSRVLLAGVLSVWAAQASAQGIGSSISPPFGLYLGPGYNSPGAAGVGWSVSPSFDLYLGPGFRSPTGGGVGAAVSPAYPLYLGRLSEGFAASSLFSLDTRGDLPGYVAPPSGLTAALGSCGTSIQLSWTSTTSDQTGFEIDAKVAGLPDIFYRRVETAGPGLRSFMHVPTDGLPRTYRVRAVRARAVSAYSNECTIAAPARAGASQPVGSVVVKSVGDGKGLNVHLMPPVDANRWDGVSRVRVEQATSPDFENDVLSTLTREVVFSGSGERTLRFEGARNQTYYFRAQLIAPCSSPSAHRVSAAVRPRFAPVLLVHGIWSSESAWGQTWTDKLAEAGHPAERVSRVTFKKCGETWMTWGDELRDDVIPSLLGPGKPWEQDECVDIIAHSQGGLASRYYIERRGGQSKVRTLVMVATPNHGGEFASFMSFINRLPLGLTPVCNPTSASVGVRALGSNSSALRQLNFGNDEQRDGSCRDEPEEEIWRRGSVEYYTIAGTGPSVFDCSPIHCSIRAILQLDPADCASDGVVVAKSVYLRALPASHQKRDREVGAGGTSHDGLTVASHGRSRPILESPEIAQWAVGRLRETNAHDAAEQSVSAAVPVIASAVEVGTSPPRREPIGDGDGAAVASDSLCLLTSFVDSLEGGAARAHCVSVDSMSQLVVFGEWSDSTLALQLRSPDSTVYSPADTLGRPWLHYESSELLGYCAFAVDHPAPGLWQGTVVAPAGPGTSRYRLDWVAKGAGLNLSAALDRDALRPAETVKLTAGLRQDGASAAGSYVASVVTPAGQAIPLVLHDDGLDGDALAADHRYAGTYIAPVQDGDYEVRVTALALNEGTSPAERFATLSFHVTAAPDLELRPGGLRIAPVISAVGQLTELRAMVHNVGDTPADSATVSFHDESTGELLGLVRVSIPAHDSSDTQLLWTPSVGGEHGVLAQAEMLGATEGVVSNNLGEAMVPVAASLPATAGVDSSHVSPVRFELSPPRPNPFRARLHLDFSVPRSGRIAIEVFDVQGRLVKRVVDGVFAAGRHAMAWEGDDARGGRARSGVYFVRMTGPGFAQTRRAVLVY